MATKSLQRHLLGLISVMLLVISASIVLAVWVSGDHYVRAKVNDDLDIGVSILNRLLVTREEQLQNSAEVLTADFGFKQAVVSNDPATIKSALMNQSQRIDADLMAMVAMSGGVQASTNSALTSQQPFPVPELLRQVNVRGVVATFIELKSEIFQIIMLPVKAPLPVGIAVIGFRVNKNLADELKQITLLDVTFSTDGGVSVPLVSTLPPDKARSVIEYSHSVHDSTMAMFQREEFIVRVSPLPSSEKLSVYLSSSLDQSYQSFDELQINILVITLLAICLSLIGAVLFSRSLSNPLKYLADFARKVAAGTYEKDVQVHSRVDEISDLTFAFNKMQSDLSDREASIRFQANHDPLTGLINRRFAVEQLDRILSSSQSNEIFICVINVLGFRSINDTFGHHIGDLTLKEVAARINRIHDVDLTARLVGNEFLLVMKRPVHADIVLMDALMLLQGSYEIGDLDVSLSFCMGVAIFPADADDANTLLQRASIALDAGRKTQQSITYFYADLEQKYRKRLTLSRDLKLALISNDGQLSMYYQPKVSGKNLTAGKFEALMRWTHPEEGFISPDFFIALAEQSGLINDLTNWVVTSVIKQIKQWRDENVEIEVAVNLSAQDLQRPQLLAKVNSQLKDFDVPPKLISFEITESEVMRDPEKAVALLDQFRLHGFDLAIDDFGTGYSSLAQLKNIPVTELKIDRAFIMNLTTLKEDQIIVRSTLDLASSFNLSVVAEGVEDEETGNLLREWGVDWLQGYFYGRPMPGTDVLEWMAQYNAGK